MPTRPDFCGSILPQRTLVSCRTKCMYAPGFKKARDCLTVLGCTNATGSYKLNLIGKSEKPRCFEHVNMNALPAIYMYKSQRNAWMS